MKQLRRRVACGEEGRGEVQRREGIDVKVEPLNKVAGRGSHDGMNAAAVVHGLAQASIFVCMHLYWHVVGMVWSWPGTAAIYQAGARVAECTVSTVAYGI